MIFDIVVFIELHRNDRKIQLCPLHNIVWLHGRLKGSAILPSSTFSFTLRRSAHVLVLAGGFQWEVGENCTDAIVVYHASDVLSSCMSVFDLSRILFRFVSNTKAHRRHTWQR